MKTARLIADVAVEVAREQGRVFVWYGNPQLCHDIYDRSGRTNAKHPLNIIAAVVGACAKSSKWQRCGYITHMGKQYPVYEMRDKLK